MLGFLGWPPTGRRCFSIGTSAAEPHRPRITRFSASYCATLDANNTHPFCIRIADFAVDRLSSRPHLRTTPPSSPQTNMHLSSALALGLAGTGFGHVIQNREPVDGFGTVKDLCGTRPTEDWLAADFALPDPTQKRQAANLTDIVADVYFHVVTNSTRLEDGYVSVRFPLHHLFFWSSHPNDKRRTKPFKNNSSTSTKTTPPAASRSASRASPAPSTPNGPPAATRPRWPT